MTYGRKQMGFTGMNETLLNLHAFVFFCDFYPGFDPMGFITILHTTIWVRIFWVHFFQASSRVANPRVEGVRFRHTLTKWDPMIDISGVMGPFYGPFKNCQKGAPLATSFFFDGVAAWWIFQYSKRPEMTLKFDIEMKIILLKAPAI